MIIGAASWRPRSSIGPRNWDAPVILGSLTGFLAVGAFDTLLDAPRVAFLFYVLVLLASLLPEYDANRDFPGKSAKEPRRAVSGAGAVPAHPGRLPGKGEELGVREPLQIC